MTTHTDRSGKDRPMNDDSEVSEMPTTEQVRAFVEAGSGYVTAAEFDRWLASVRAESLREAHAMIKGTYDLQCPVAPAEEYAHPAAQWAHQWWQTCLGGSLDRLLARATSIESEATA